MLHGGEHGHDYGVMAISAVLAIVGILAAWLAYSKRPAIAEGVARALPTAYRVLNNKWYVDEIYDACIVRPLRGIELLQRGRDRIAGLWLGVTGRAGAQR